MEKTPRTGPMAPDNKSVEKRDKTQPFVKGTVKESLRNMPKKSGAPDRKRLKAGTPDTLFEGDGYSVRRLPDDEARRVLAEREGVAARQENTEAFLAFLMSRPPADDADPR